MRNKGDLLAKLAVTQIDDGRYAVTVGDVSLRTSMGGHHPVEHRSKSFLENLVEELNLRGKLSVVNDEVAEPKGFDSYSLFSLQKDWVEPGRDNLTTDFILEMIHEPLLERSASPETWSILPFLESTADWLAGMGVRLVDLDYVDHSRVLGVPDDHFRINENMGDNDQEAFAALTQALMNLYATFSNEQKAVATYLTNISNHFLIYSLRLAAGACSPEEYGMAFAAANLFDPDEDELEAEAIHVGTLASRAVRFIELSSR